MLPSYRGFLVRFADSGELEYGAEIAPGSCHCAGDRGFGWLDPFVFFRVLDLVRGWIARVLSLLWSWIVFGFFPRLAPWEAFFRRSAAGSVATLFCEVVRVAARLLLLAGLRLLPPRGRGRLRYTGFDGGAEFGVFDRVLAGVVGDFAHHRLLADPVMGVAAIGARLRDASQVHEKTRVAGIQ